MYDETGIWMEWKNKWNLIIKWTESTLMTRNKSQAKDFLDKLQWKLSISDDLKNLIRVIE